MKTRRFSRWILDVQVEDGITRDKRSLKNLQVSLTQSSMQTLHERSYNKGGVNFTNFAIHKQLHLLPLAFGFTNCTPKLFCITLCHLCTIFAPMFTSVCVWTRAHMNIFLFTVELFEFVWTNINHCNWMSMVCSNNVMQEYFILKKYHTWKSD